MLLLCAMATANVEDSVNEAEAAEEVSPVFHEKLAAFEAESTKEETAEEETHETIERDEETHETIERDPVETVLTPHSEDAFVENSEANEEAPEDEAKESKPEFINVDVFVPGVPAHDVIVERFSAKSSTGRRLLSSKVGFWGSTGTLTPSASNGLKSASTQVPMLAATYSDTVTAVTVRVPHDGNANTQTVVLTLHGRATDPDAFVSNAANGGNDPYTPHLHDPYSGSSGSDSDGGPRAQTAGDYTSQTQTTFSTGTGQNVGPGKESFFAAWNGASTASNPRGAHDPLKLSWACSEGQTAPEIAAELSVGHSQGFRESTGQRTQGNEPFYDDERASCTSTADVTGFKRSCLVHGRDQHAAKLWGAHALQDGPDIMVTLTGGNVGSGNVNRACQLTAVDPYGATSQMLVTITILPEQNNAPVALWRAGGVTSYTVPHDRSPTTNHVQVLLDGDFTDADNNDNNIGPLGNPSIETTASAQRRGLGVQEQMGWQGSDASKDPTAWAMFRGRPNAAAATANMAGIGRTAATYSTVEHAYDNGQKSGNDKMTFEWSCPTCGAAGGCKYYQLRPTVTLPGPAHTPSSTWADPGGQTGSTSEGSQWAGSYVDHSCTLTVTDSYGAQGSMTQVIRVNREPNTKPAPNAGADQSYTVPHDFYPTAETNEVLVTLYGGATVDANGDKMKHKWVCTAGGLQTAWATVELPFPVQLGGVATGFTYNPAGGIETGAADPNYVTSVSAIQTSEGWGADSGNSGNGDLFFGTHTRDANQVTVTLKPGTHTCTLTSTDTYNESNSDTVVISVSAEPNSSPNAS